MANWRTLLLTVLAIYGGYRLSLAAQSLQWPSKDPAVPAHVQGLKAPASPLAKVLNTPAVPSKAIQAAPGSHQKPATFQAIPAKEYFTAPWVSAWGSIVGAALGAGLAVYGAVWFERRERRQRSKDYAAMLAVVTKRVMGAASKLVESLEDKELNTAVVVSGMHVFESLHSTLDKFAPFVELRYFTKVQTVVEVSLYLGVLNAAAAQLRTLLQDSKEVTPQMLEGLKKQASKLCSKAKAANEQLMAK